MAFWHSWTSGLESLYSSCAGSSAWPLKMMRRLARTSWGDRPQETWRGPAGYLIHHARIMVILELQQVVRRIHEKECQVLLDQTLEARIDITEKRNVALAGKA